MAVLVKQDGEDVLVEVPIRLSLTEVERLTRIVERARRSDTVAPAGENIAEETPQKLARFASFMINARRRRDAAFSGVEFAEPAWDMLLDLYVQYVEGRPVSVSSLCTAAAVPSTTALRWIDIMVRGGHFVRRPDPFDGRRAHVALAASSVAMIESYLCETRRRARTALN